MAATAVHRIMTREDPPAPLAIDPCWCPFSVTAYNGYLTNLPLSAPPLLLIHTLACMHCLVILRSGTP